MENLPVKRTYSEEDMSYTKNRIVFMAFETLLQNNGSKFDCDRDSTYLNEEAAQVILTCGANDESNQPMPAYYEVSLLQELRNPILSNLHITRVHLGGQRELVYEKNISTLQQDLTPKHIWHLLYTMVYDGLWCKIALSPRIMNKFLEDTEHAVYIPEDLHKECPEDKHYRSPPRLKEAVEMDGRKGHIWAINLVKKQVTIYWTNVPIVDNNHILYAMIGQLAYDNYDDNWTTHEELKNRIAYREAED